MHYQPVEGNQVAYTCTCVRPTCRHALCIHASPTRISPLYLCLLVEQLDCPGQEIAAVLDEGGLSSRPRDTANELHGLATRR